MTVHIFFKGFYGILSNWGNWIWITLIWESIPFCLYCIRKSNYHCNNINDSSLHFHLPLLSSRKVFYKLFVWYFLALSCPTNILLSWFLKKAFFAIFEHKRHLKSLINRYAFAFSIRILHKNILVNLFHEISYEVGVMLIRIEHFYGPHFAKKTIKFALKDEHVINAHFSLVSF